MNSTQIKELSTESKKRWLSLARWRSKEINDILEAASNEPWIPGQELYDRYHKQVMKEDREG